MVSIDSIIYYSEKFNQLVNLIRDEKKDKQNAKMNVGFLLAQIQRLYKKQSVFVGKKTDIFPVRGYSSDAIGGKNGDGFKPGNYTFYDGNRHTGHPAHDIFIRDKDQNCLDDRSGKPVNIISLSNGIVIASKPTWQVFSKLRGGIYLIVYNPIEDLLYYYAHNNKLFVKPGTIVRAGDKLAELGRSGMNAFKVRSPTHLHLMALKVKPNGNLVPVDLYPVLKMIIK